MGNSTQQNFGLEAQSRLLEALEEATCLSAKVGKEVRRLWLNNRASLLQMDGPVGLIAEQQRVFPLEKPLASSGNAASALTVAFQSFFNHLHREWALLPAPGGPGGAWCRADWYALILRNADRGHPFFPFIRYGGQGSDGHTTLADRNDNANGGAEAVDLIDHICRPENEGRVFLLSDIGAVDETAGLESVVLSVTPSPHGRSEGPRESRAEVGQLEVIAREGRLEIKLVGPWWQQAFAPQVDAQCSTQDVLEYILALQVPAGCSMKLPTDDRQIPSCLRPGESQSENAILTRLWRLVNLYYWHLSQDTRSRLSAASEAQLFVVWHLYPYFGAHLGAGGMCEAIAEPWSGPNDVLSDYVKAPRRMMLMKTIATVLMSGFDNQMLYAAEMDGTRGGREATAADFVHEFESLLDSAGEVLDVCRRNERCTTDPVSLQQTVTEIGIAKHKMYRFRNHACERSEAVVSVDWKFVWDLVERQLRRKVTQRVNVWRQRPLDLAFTGGELAKLHRPVTQFISADQRDRSGELEQIAACCREFGDKCNDLFAERRTRAEIALLEAHLCAVVPALFHGYIAACVRRISTGCLGAGDQIVPWNLELGSEGDVVVSNVVLGRDFTATRARSTSDWKAMDSLQRHFAPDVELFDWRVENGISTVRLFLAPFLSE
jgi:hypothetical protein